MASSIPAGAAAAWRNRVNPQQLLARIGRCLTFGCDSSQTTRAAHAARAIAQSWHTATLEAQGCLVAKGASLSRVRLTKDALTSSRAAGGTLPHDHALPALRGMEAVPLFTALADRQVSALFTYLEKSASSKVRSRWSAWRQSAANQVQVRKCQIPFCTTVLPPASVSVYPKVSLPSNDTTEEGSEVVISSYIWSHSRRALVGIVRHTLVPRRGTATFPEWFVEEMRRSASGQEQEGLLGLISAVERLEKETWDREDAVEDLGSATP